MLHSTSKLLHYGVVVYYLLGTLVVAVLRSAVVEVNILIVPRQQEGRGSLQKGKVMKQFWGLSFERNSIHTRFLGSFNSYLTTPY